MSTPNTTPNEPNKGFRDKWFSGNDRELLRQGKWAEIDLGSRTESGLISEHDHAGRVRQGYLAECRGDYETAQAIYDSIGFDRVVFDGKEMRPYDEAPYIDEEVEHYGE